MKRRDVLKVFSALGITGLGIYLTQLYSPISKGKKVMSDNKKLYTIVSPQEKHWVGDGFYVSTLFSPHQTPYQYTTPFILMDHAAPKYFEPTIQKKGVGVHPHRGFETVTFAIKGEIDHRDSGGGGGTITTGGVQWMTAASGVVHEEFHSKDFAQKGGDFEMVQLWVNLPAKDKMNKPRYQSKNNEDFPIVEYKNSKAKIIAGELKDNKSDVLTHTPMNIYEIDSNDRDEFSIDFSRSSTLLVLQLKGESKLNDNPLKAGEMAIFEREGYTLNFQPEKDSKLLVLNGEPIDEPIVPYGPFVMNTKQEILEAMKDYEAGKMGQLVQESKS